MEDNGTSVLFFHFFLIDPPQKFLPAVIDVMVARYVVSLYLVSSLPDIQLNRIGRLTSLGLGDCTPSFFVNSSTYLSVL
jgi:hypothetical protein